ncbi:MAG TPA: hypothetical protein VFY87_09435, partial [Geminicoccaceae bacterium]|nr:hypothetical protein [Geminicoccaceae bacterium]
EDGAPAGTNAMSSGRQKAQQAPIGPWLMLVSAEGKWRPTGTAAALAGVGGSISTALLMYTGGGLFSR